MLRVSCYLKKLLLKYLYVVTLDLSSYFRLLSKVNVYNRGFSDPDIYFLLLIFVLFLSWNDLRVQ